LPHEKSAGSVAFSLPQDSSLQLMFGAACYGEQALSASRGFEFCARPRGNRASAHMLRKCLKQRGISYRTQLFVPRCG
jgi:hypothetical protein